MINLDNLILKHIILIHNNLMVLYLLNIEIITKES